MQNFFIGQCWISAAESQLGLGMVTEVAHRTVSITFPATAEVRIYARQNAPLVRVRFNAGDWIQNQAKESLQVITLEERDELILYHCENEAGQSRLLAEGELDYHLQLNQPGARLLSGQIDRNQWFSLRAQTREITDTLLQSPVYGLTGCRTSFIPHQLYIAYEVSRRFSPRVLLADEVGLGKTIEAGLILHQQLLLERAHRVLIVVPESLVHQWLVEMGRRFNLMFSVFDTSRCLALAESEQNGSQNDNPFHSEQLVICSLQFLLDNPPRSRQALQGEWDLLVVDEAHHLAWSPHSISPEYQLIEMLAQQTPGILLLTATPEQLGKESHFARLRLLDPSRFSDLDEFLQTETHYDQIADLVETLQVQAILDPAQHTVLKQYLGEHSYRQWLSRLNSKVVENQATAQAALIAHLLDHHGTGRVLFRNSRHAVHGFPDRALHAYALRIPEQWQQAWNQTKQDIDLQSLLSPEQVPEMHAIWIHCDPRVTWLGEFLYARKDHKILVITNSAQTVLDLVKQTRKSHGIRAACFHEGMDLIERDRATADFADHEAGAQVLICSEIGSEGRNFQFSHHLVLFDLPTNPDLLEQRIGRLDRIGQTATVNIHVPYLKQSAQAVMFRWYHEGLNAFRHTCPCGYQVYTALSQQLHRHLIEPTASTDALIEETAAQHASLNLALQQGRDRLLEINSCRQTMAKTLIDLAIKLDVELDIFQYMERIYDCYGIDSEIHGQDSWVISPSDNMLTKMPGLPEDGMTLTYRRSTALANEDMHFLSWEHPFVRNAMEFILSSEFGNTALVAIKYAPIQPGNLLLECHFVIVFSEHNSRNNERYFPNRKITVIIDEKGRQHTHQLTGKIIQKLLQHVDHLTAVKIIQARQKVLRDLLKNAKIAAGKQIPSLIDQARETGRKAFEEEIDRLLALQKINPGVRHEEIDFFRSQLAGFESSLDNAQLKLDAVRVMVTI